MANDIYSDVVDQLPAAPPVPSSAPPNPYASAVDSIAAGEQQALRTSLVQADQTTPDRAADVQRLSTKTGIAPDIIERNFDAIQKRSLLVDTPYAQMLRETPALSTWASEPANAAVAKDDMEHLGALEWLVKAPSRALAQGIDSTRYALLRAESITRDLTRAEQDQLDAFKFGMTNGGELGAGSSWFRGAVTGLMKNIPMLFGAGIAANKYGLAGAAEVGVAGAIAGSVLPGAGTIAGLVSGAGTGYAAGALYGGFKFGAQLAAGQAYDEFSAFKDELGRPLDPSVAKAAALATGLVNGALMTGGFKVLAETVPGLDRLGGFLTTSAVKQALLQPTVRAGLLAATKTFAGTLTFETANMVAQRAAQILIGDVAKGESGQPFANREASESFADLGHTATGALQDFALLTAAGPAAGFALGRVHAQEAMHNATFFQALGEGVAQSKTGQRLPAALESMLTAATKDGPVEHVYAPIDTWSTYWQSKGVDPAQMAAEVTGDPQAFDQATRTGEDLVIPTAKYATTLAATEHNAYFANELRLAPEQMNAREAQAFEAANKQGVSDGDVAAAEPMAPVRESIVTQLEAAGVEQSVADNYATLYEHAFQTLGARAGIDPVDLFNRYGLTIERPDLVDRTADAAHNPQEYLNVKPVEPEPAREPAAAEEGAGLSNRADEQRLADSRGPVEAGGAGDVAEPRRLSTPGLPDVDEVFRRPDPAHTASRLTPEVRTALGWIAEELDNFPTTDRTWNYVGDEHGWNGNAAGGKYDVVEGAAGTPVYHDVLAFSPVNVTPSGRNKGKAARLARGTRADVLAAIHKLVETGAVTTNLQEGALRVAENRLADNYEHLSRPWLPKPDAIVAPKEFTDALAAAIDHATESDSIDTGEGDTSFDVTEFHQAPRPEFVPLGGEADENADRHALQAGAAAQIERVAQAGETDPRKAAIREAAQGGKARVLFQADPLTPATVDTLDTGEQQPRLPGAEDVREQHVPTPEFDAPFSLTSEVATSKTGGQGSLFQETRGAIRIGPNREMRIDLLKAADLSTFLHESGHFFLEVLGDLTNTVAAIDPDKRTDVQQALLADHAALREWLADEDHTGPGLSVKQHEQFARGFEAYLMEGKAPSAELRGVFARFRTWLVGVYRSLKGLNVELTPEVRGVFDRLVASDAAIEQARAEGFVEPLFTDAAMAGMTPEAFDAYRATVSAASQRAKDELQTRLLRDYTREQQAYVNGERETIRSAVAADVYQEPLYRAMAAIRKGTHPDGSPLVEGEDARPLKFAKADLAGRYTPDELKALRDRQLYTAKEGEGAAPDAVAELFGFPSGDALVRALIAAPTMKDRIDSETSARLKAKLGDVLLDGTLADKAQQAVYGEGRQEVIHAELKALTAGMVKGTIPPTSVINAMAERRIADTKIRDVRPGQFLMAARRASQRAFALLSTHEDRAGAVQAKQQELVNLALYREATKAQEAVDSAVSYLKSFDTAAKRERLGKAGADYLQQIDGLRERFDLTRRTLKDIDRRTSLKDFIEAQQAKGLELAIAPELQNEVRRQHYRDGTVDELRGVADAVKSIDHIARLKDRLLRNQAKRELEALATEGAAAIDANSNGPRKVDIEPRLPGSKGKRDIRGWMIAHRPILALFRQMDGFKDGFMFDNLWRPAHEARNAEGSMGRAAATELKRIHSERFHGEEHTLYEDTYIPALDANLSTAARLAVAFNAGNEGNRERLRGGGIGNTGPLDDVKVQAILDTLSDRDWKYVNETTALINSYRDQIGSLYKRVTGVEPTWVDPTPFHTKAGEMPGGYYPIAYEGRASAQALPGPEASFADILTKSSYMRFTTANGHTEQRVAHTGIPLRADLGVIGEHLQQVIHDLTHREMLVDAGRILGRKEIQDAIYRNYGDQHYNEIKAAFRDLAVGTMPAPEWYRVIAPVRRRASMARLAWNFATMVRHVTNITSGMVRVGDVEVMKAIPKWLGSGKDAAFSSSWVSANSELMAHRWNHRMEELASINNEIGLNRGKWAATMRDTAVKAGLNPDLTHRMADSYLYGIHKIIQMAEIPTWIAAYQKAVDGGGEHARAVASADNAILDAFGGGDLLDQAGVQRSYGGKLFSTFMTYGLSLHRQNFEVFSKDQSVGRKVVDATLLNIVPVMLLGAVFNQVHGKNSYAKEVAEDAFAEATGMFVFVRELSNALRSPDYSGPSSLSVFGTAARLIFNLKQAVMNEEGGNTKKATTAAKTSAELAGQFYGVPVYQIEKTAAGIQALSEGKTTNPAAVLFGPPKKGTN